MSKKTFAIASAAEPKKVMLWCEHLRNTPRGRKFFVFNGAWEGLITKDGVLFVHEKRTVWADYGWRGVVVWEGVVPDLKGGNDYNAVIDWIERQIAGRPEPSKPPELTLSSQALRLLRRIRQGKWYPLTGRVPKGLAELENAGLVEVQPRVKVAAMCYVPKGTKPYVPEKLPSFEEIRP